MKVNPSFSSLRKTGNFTLSSGRKSKYFYDFHLMPLSEMQVYTGMLWMKAKHLDFATVVAPATGGIIPGYIFAQLANVPLVIFEKDKFYKPCYPIHNYIIVDDVVTSFDTVQRCIKYNHALSKGGCVGIASFMFRGSDNDFSNNKLPFYYLSRGELEE